MACKLSMIVLISFVGVSIVVADRPEPEFNGKALDETQTTVDEATYLLGEGANDFSSGDFQGVGDDFDRGLRDVFGFTEAETGAFSTLKRNS